MVEQLNISKEFQNRLLKSWKFNVELFTYINIETTYDFDDFILPYTVSGLPS